jgi:hypothetical protein
MDTVATEIKECLAEESPDTLLADGFDAALIGTVRQFTKTLALYDYDKCVEVLMHRDGLLYDEAVEHMEFNVVGAWMGEHTPVFSKTAGYIDSLIYDE